jgi:quercetin dioxygenase-like cupin family protein
MAYRNKTISNPKTGQEIRFIQTASDTGGKMLEMESVFQPFSTEPTSHYHPVQEEAFFVREGTISVRLEGKVFVLHEGEHLLIPRKAVHSMWNHSGKKAVVSWKVYPALNTEHFLEAAMGLAISGKTNEKGIPGILQGSLLARKFSGVYRMAKPPYPVQQLVFTLLFPVARLKGYRAEYGQYLD